ncbi:MAG: hypothetical protein NTZ33_13140 [Bacteroidetes bacterium]|nr:hypothetical protein [Bacteroidota bacterium]
MKKPKKIQVIKQNDRVYITTIDRFDSIFKKANINHYSGKIINIRQQQVDIELDMEVINHNFGDYTNQKRIYYNISDSLKKTVKDNIRNIDINNISSINLYNNKDNPLVDIGIGLAITSFTYAFFIAPFTCINYKNGNFNNILYYKSLAACGIACTLGITFTLFEKNKFFSISKNPPPDTKYNNIYNIEIK